MLKNKIAYWRDRVGMHGINRSRLALKIGVSRSYITRLEKGQVMPSAETMFKIADVFNCHVDDVFEYLPNDIQKG